MSTYARMTKNPEKGKFEPAVWVDDYFGQHHYGVRFSDGSVFDPREYGMETNDDPIPDEWLDEHFYMIKGRAMDEVMRKVEKQLERVLRALSKR